MLTPLGVGAECTNPLEQTDRSQGITLGGALAIQGPVGPPRFEESCFAKRSVAVLGAGASPPRGHNEDVRTHLFSEAWLSYKGGGGAPAGVLRIVRFEYLWVWGARGPQGRGRRPRRVIFIIIYFF